MTDEMKKALEETEEYLLNMPQEEFDKLMEESKDSYLANVLIELHAFEEIK